MTRRARVAIVAVRYLALWVVTAKVGPHRVEARIKAQAEQRWGQPLPLAPSVFDGRAHYPYFAIRTLSPMPFVLFSEYGSGTGSHADEGGHSWYLWLGPLAWPIRTTATWRQ